MKQLFANPIGMAFLAIITTTLTACSNVGGTRISNNTTPVAVGGGYTTQTTYQTVEKTVAPAAKAGLEVYGNQPSVPTDAAKANQTTWGQTFGNSMAYNEMRPKDWARLETPSADTRILVDQANGWTWKVGCHNRIVVAQSQTITQQIPQTIQVPVQQQVAAAPAGVHVDNSVHVDLKGAVGAVMRPVAALAGQALLQAQQQGGGCYRPQPRYRQPAPCPLPQRVTGRPPQQHIPNCPRCGQFHPFKPCPQVAQQQQGQVKVNVHNVNVNGNDNRFRSSGSSSYRPSYNSGNNGGSNYRPSGQGRPFGNGSPNSGYAPGNPGLSYFNR